MSLPSPSSHEFFRPFVEQILQRTPKPGSSVILAVTSPSAGNGTTYVSKGLLNAFKDIVRDRAKLIELQTVQADLRSRLTLSKEKSHLIDDELSDHEPPAPSEHVVFNLHRSCLERIAKSVDVLLVDCPALSTSHNLYGFASSFDGIVVVIGADDTTRHQLAKAETRLVQSGGLIEGHVFNLRRKPMRRMLRFSKEG